MSYITVGSASGPIAQFLDEWLMENLEEVSPSNIPSATKIFLNGLWLGVHREPEDLVKQLVDMRRHVEINSEVSVVRDVTEKELRIYTDPGRISRPLFVIDDECELVCTSEMISGDDEQGCTWDDLLLQGAVEYVDTEEEETVLICMTPEDVTETRNAMNGIAPSRPTDNVTARLKGNVAIKKWTHCEIHPSMILGICASIVPFPDHNQVHFYNAVSS